MLPEGLGSNQSLIYVHIGKTGGATLDSVLRSNCNWYRDMIERKNLCNRALDRQEKQGFGTMISRSTKATLHFEPNNEFRSWIDEATAFLVTLRNPISRAVSAFNMFHPNNTDIWQRKSFTRAMSVFNMRHPNNTFWRPKQEPLAHTNLTEEEDDDAFYNECFPTVEHLAKAIQMADPENYCYKVGVDTLNGNDEGEFNLNLGYNYAYYQNMTFDRYPERPVLALRTEHIWEDLKRVEQLLGGSGDHFSRAGKDHTWGSEEYHVHGGLSPSGVQTFCCFLAAEMQIYDSLLRKAVNLSPSEKEATLAKLYDQCGLENTVLHDGIYPFPWVEWAHSRPECMCPPNIYS
jgi:hypothetical protein